MNPPKEPIVESVVYES